MIQQHQIEQIIETLYPRTLPMFDQQTFQQHLQKCVEIMQDLQFYREKIELESKKVTENYLYRCPFGERQILLNRLGKITKQQVMQPQISRFYPNQYFINPRTLYSNSKTQKFKVKNSKQHSVIATKVKTLFFQKGFISNLQRVLLYFPELFLKIDSYRRLLMESELTIDQSTSYFLACAASAQYGCEYLLDHLLPQYLSEGGNIDWMKGKIPQKINKLLKLNHFLAHCPWKINLELQRDLELCWSKRQIFQSSLIMTFFHYLSTICLVFGLKSENQSVDRKKLFPKQIKTKNISLIQSKITQDLTQSVMDVINNNFLIDGRKSNNSDSYSTDSEQLQNRITQHIFSIDQQIKTNQSYLNMRQTYQNIVWKCSGNLRRKQEDYPSYFQSQWNLIENCYPIMEHLSLAHANQFTQLVQFIKNIPFEDSQGVSSKQRIYSHMFLKSVRYYSDSFLGFIHDAYDYSNKMKSMLTFQERFFIMIVTRYSFLADQQLSKYIHVQSQMDKYIYINIVSAISINKMQRSISYLLKNFNYQQNQQ